jgi:hypothetical protein
VVVALNGKVYNFQDCEMVAEQVANVRVLKVAACAETARSSSTSRASCLARSGTRGRAAREMLVSCNRAVRSDANESVPSQPHRKAASCRGGPLRARGEGGERPRGRRTTSREGRRHTRRRAPRRGPGSPRRRTEWRSDVRVPRALDGRVDYSQGIWTLMMFELWHREYVDRNPEPLEVAAYASGRSTRRD